ncbi:MAG: DUF167 domain-containing protein [Parcubacteria group bacterium]|nr:DUF167 domain-containing protein [Parcubacteria group bacterium]
MPDLAAFINKPGYYRIKVTTKQPQTRFTKVLADGTIKISLTSAPEKGKANAELLKFIAKELNLAPSLVRLISGQTSPLKVVVIDSVQA